MHNIEKLIKQVDSIENKIYAIRIKSTDSIIASMAKDMRERFPKREIEIKFGLGAHIIVIDENIIDQYSRQGEVFQEYFGLLDKLNESHWDQRGVMSNDIKIEPVNIHKR